LLDGVTLSDILPAVLSCPILLAANSVNHKFPSAPSAMLAGWLEAVGIVNWAVTAGVGVGAGVGVPLVTGVP
jgi:hypothetical protein